MNSHNPSAELFAAFLNQPDIATRVQLAHQATNGRTPDEALSVLFAALNIAVDNARAVSEVAVELGLDRRALVAALERKAEQRRPDYLAYEFNLIVEGLDDPPNQH